MPDAHAHRVSAGTRSARDGEIIPPDRASGKTIIDHETELARLDGLAGWMDSAFRIPGTGIRFGLDSLVGLVPGIGDTAALLPSGYIVMTAKRLGVSNMTMGRMLANIGIDWLIGLVPFVGDLFDIGFKANRKNVELLRRDLEKRGDAARSTRA